MKLAVNLLLGLALCAAPAHAQGKTWTVDDDGPADFDSIGGAIASAGVAPGDVLEVFPGYYPDFTLNKPLHIIAAADTKFEVNDCLVTSVSEFSIVGMHAWEYLSVSGVTGRGILDDCRVGGGWWACETTGLSFLGHSSITDCDDLIITRSVFWGTEGCYSPSQIADCAMYIGASTVAIVDSSLVGGLGDKYGGREALSVGGSYVTLAGCTLNGECGGWTSTWCAPAVAVGGNSQVRIRGSSEDSLEAGSVVSPVQCDSSSSVTVSGVTISPPRLEDGVTWVEPAEPYMSIWGSDGPGAAKFVELYGPPSDVGLVISSVDPAHVVLENDLDPIWLNPASLLTVVPLITVDQETPASYRIRLPPDPSLAGIVLILQAWFPELRPHEMFLTNPANIILRW